MRVGRKQIVYASFTNAKCFFLDEIFEMHDLVVLMN